MAATVTTDDSTLMMNAFSKYGIDDDEMLGIGSKHSRRWETQSEQIPVAITYESIVPQPAITQDLCSLVTKSIQTEVGEAVKIMTAEWQTKNERQEKEWKQKLNELEQKMRKQDKMIKNLEEIITTQIAEVIGKVSQGNAGVATKVEVLQGQYETTQELMKIKGQVAGMESAINGVIESVRKMNCTIEKRLDEMTR